MTYVSNRCKKSTSSYSLPSPRILFTELLKTKLAIFINQIIKRVEEN